MTKKCSSCNFELSDDARFCNNCGAQQPPLANSQQGAYQRPDQAPPAGQNAYQGQSSRANGVPPTSSEVFTVEDVEKNKVISALAYFIFFLPLIAAPDSAFGKFHANQGLLLLILSIAGHTILGIVPIIGWVILPLFSLFCFVLAIMGLVNTLNGKARELPLIGQYRIFR